MTINIIVSIRHAAAINTTLLPPPPPRSCCTSKRAAATAEIALPTSCRLHCQAGRCCRAAAAATSAKVLPLPRYHCLQKQNLILLTNLFFTTMVTTARSINGGATRQQQ
jgi:hypothetical protein